MRVIVAKDEEDFNHKKEEVKKKYRRSNIIGIFTGKNHLKMIKKNPIKTRVPSKNIYITKTASDGYGYSDVIDYVVHRATA